MEVVFTSLEDDIGIIAPLCEKCLALGRSIEHIKQDLCCVKFLNLLHIIKEKELRKSLA